MLAYIKNLADTWCIFNLVPGWEMWLNPGIITNLLGLNGSRSKEYNFFVVQLLKFVVSTAQSGIMQLLCASWPHTLVTHKLPAHLPTPISAVCKKWLQKTWNSKRTITIFLKMTRKFSIDWIRNKYSAGWVLQPLTVLKKFSGDGSRWLWQGHESDGQLTHWR
jgi:hypothetical protein